MSWLLEMRKEKQLSQKEVAQAIGVERSYYTRIENGLVPSVKVAKSLSEVFDVEWTIFFDNVCAKSAQNKKCKQTS